MSKMRNVLQSFVSCCLATIAASQPCRGQEHVPSPSIFELRPPHVRVSEPGESAGNPRGGRSFDFFDAPPAIPLQNEVRLSEEDSLSLVYPASGGSSHSGGSSLFDRLRVNGSQLELDLFHFFNPFGPFGHTIIHPHENSLFIGQLSAGEYQVNIRNWYLAPNSSSVFDPETFSPPSNVITPTSPFFAIPIYSDDPPVLLQSSFGFRVLGVPEASTLALTVVAFLVSIGGARHRVR
jgi:hypothetical protein